METNIKMYKFKLNNYKIQTQTSFNSTIILQLNTLIQKLKHKMKLKE